MDSKLDYKHQINFTTKVRHLPGVVLCLKVSHCVLDKNLLSELYSKQISR